MLLFCLHKNVKHGGLFVQDYPKITLKRLDPKRYGISSNPSELRSRSTDFLFLISVSPEFSLGLFSSAGLPGVLTSSFTAVLEDLCPGERKWPRELPFTHHGHGGEVVTAERTRGCLVYGTWDNTNTFTHVGTDAVSEWAKQGFSGISGGYHSLCSSCQAKASFLFPHCHIQAPGPGYDCIFKHHQQFLLKS